MGAVVVVGHDGDLLPSAASRLLNLFTALLILAILGNDGHRWRNTLSFAKAAKAKVGIPTHTDSNTVPRGVRLGSPTLTT